MAWGVYAEKTKLSRNFPLSKSTKKYISLLVLGKTVLKKHGLIKHAWIKTNLEAKSQKAHNNMRCDGKSVLKEKKSSRNNFIFPKRTNLSFSISEFKNILMFLFSRKS